MITMKILATCGNAPTQEGSEKGQKEEDYCNHEK